MVSMYRQGDVLLIRVEELPPKKKRRKMKTDIIVRGEATGHAHRIFNGTLYQNWSRTQRPRRFIKANKGAKLIHDEHGEIDLEEGIYQIVRQREYDPSNPEGLDWVED
jgi:hypothetical protein